MCRGEKATISSRLKAQHQQTAARKDHQSIIYDSIYSGLLRLPKIHGLAVIQIVGYVVGNLNWWRLPKIHGLADIQIVSFVFGNLNWWLVTRSKQII